MATINDATRMCKRIMLSNLLTNDYNIAVTPLLSGKHGIGKSQVAKKIAKDIGGVCITIEGGTLKEGEITGIPYQYRNEGGEIEFKFLPYYAVKRIQEAEKHIGESEEHEHTLEEILKGLENRYTQDNLIYEEKVSLIRSGKVTPVILFFDEINRTDVTVFRELMNIVLTRSVNGYRFPWWVFIMAAMNPCTQNSLYATNEMDPAQLDRFIKIKVHEDVDEWIDYAIMHDVDKTLIEFISNNGKALSYSARELDDDDIPTPSPRGWNMVDLIIKSENKLDSFFTNLELEKKDWDIRSIISSKVGNEAATMYYTSLRDNSKLVLADDIFLHGVEGIDSEVRTLIKRQSTARNSITSKSVVKYMTENIGEIIRDAELLAKTITKLSAYISLLDNSSKLLFAATITNAKSERGISLYKYISEIFDDSLLDLLEKSNLNEMLVVSGD